MKSTSKAPEAPGQSSIDLRAAYRTMQTIRQFEEEIQRLFLEGLVHGTTHLCNGHEAVSVGVAAALSADDVVAGTYRGHGHLLARGSDPERLAAEMMGRETGVCRGRAGSLNLTDIPNGYLGSFAIIGGSIGCATGAGLSLKGTGRVAVAFFGDGAANQGYFHECLNFASVMELPVLFVCEHNLYGEYTPWEQVTGGLDIAARATALGIRAELVDGMDVAAVHDAALAAITPMRDGAGPALLECRTYRFVGHSRTDPATYRKPGELDEWLKRDPLIVAEEALVAAGVDESELEADKRQLAEDLKSAFERAIAAPFPSAEEFAGA